MLVKVTIEVDGRQAGSFEREVSGTAAEVEEEVQAVKQRTGKIVLEHAFCRLGREMSAGCCCGKTMSSRGMRSLTLETTSGRVIVERRRCRCSVCGREEYPADAQLCTGPHLISRPLSKRICQLATVEHFTRLPGLLLDQHGVTLGHETILNLVHDVGTAADVQRRAESEQVLHRAPEAAKEIVPQFHPQRLYISCDGIMYCTNQTEPVAGQPGVKRLIWQQMKVGCVYWQDAQENWNKQMIWGRESPQEFGAALFRLACRCGYLEASEKIFAADGGAWCWDIRDEYFGAAQGILDWYHASEHVWEAARKVERDQAEIKIWVKLALDQMHVRGGAGLVDWLRQQQRQRRGRARDAITQLLAYVEPKTELMAYPEYRDRDYQIGTGMIESTCKQLVGLRLKGPGMHWTELGALAVTALRATDFNQQWHSFWRNLTLTA